VLSDQVDSIIASFPGPNTELPELLLSGKLRVELVPQGTIAAKLEAGASGLPGKEQYLLPTYVRILIA
jgi:acyl CoA:acetate/3-ketoacid CoA transferase alpha subunit